MAKMKMSKKMTKMKKSYQICKGKEQKVKAVSLKAAIIIKKPQINQVQIKINKHNSEDNSKTLKNIPNPCLLNNRTMNKLKKKKT